MKPPVLLSMTTPLGEGFEIPYHDFGPKEKPPAIALVGGIHGNELNSIYVLARLAAFLDPIDQKKRPDQALNERVIIIPAVNIPGMHTGSRVWPFDNTDINRMFPGYAQGETTQRIADAVFQLTKTAPVRIDIHSSNLEIEELPQVRIYGSSPALPARARLFGLPAVIECPINTIASSTLLHAWRDCGGENFVIQAGQAGVLQKEHCDLVFKALIQFLIRQQLLSGGLNGFSEESGDVYYFGLGQMVSVVSEKAGLFVSQAHLGRWIERGDVLGTVYDGFDGSIRARIYAPISGLLTALRCQALLYQGDLLARIQSRTPVNSSADTYLLGQGQ